MEEIQVNIVIITSSCSYCGYLSCLVPVTIKCTLTYYNFIDIIHRWCYNEETNIFQLCTYLLQIGIQLLWKGLIKTAYFLLMAGFKLNVNNIAWRVNCVEDHWQIRIDMYS